MPKPFKGKIALDIRDSTPDWEPYLAPKAPEGAPNVLFLAWDDLGYATMDMFGGPVETPNMRRIADRGVKFANFHTTALCSPTRASLLTGRNATTQRHGDDRRVRVGLPGHLDPHPVRERLHLRGARRARLQHLLRRQVAPDARARSATSPRTRAAGRSGAGFERFYGWLGGETNNWYPDLVHDNHQIDPPGRPEDGYHLADDLADKAIEFIRDAKVIDPDKPFFMYLAPQAGHAPHQVPLEWADKYKGAFDQGYEAIRAGILARQIELGLLPEGTELSPINPHGEPERTEPRRQAVARARHRAAVGLAERRRAAAVRPDGRGVRRLHLLLRRPVRPGPRLPRGVGPARQHDHRRRSPTTARAARAARTASFNEWRFFNGLAERPRGHARAHRRARHAEVVQPLQHRLGVGVRHAVPVLEALGRRRGRRRRHVHRVVAGEDHGRPDAAPAVHPRRRRRADDLRPARHRAARGDQGLPAEPDRGRELRRRRSPTRRARASETQFYTMLGQRSIYHDGWLARTVHPPLVGLGRLREGRVGAVPPRDRPRADARTSRPTTRNGSSR